MEVVGENGIKIIGIHNMPPTDGEATELVLHLDNTDPTKITKELTAKGYTVEVRER
jgi:hypothetical protein